jgi:two-component system sensor histidine kinase VicK
MRWPALLTVLIMLVVTELGVWQATRMNEIKTLEVLANRGSEARATLESELNTVLQLTLGMTSYIQSQEGELQPERLNAWLRNLTQYSRHVRNIGIAPGNRISFVHPLEGNEAALGLYYPDLKDQWPAVEKLIKDQKATLTGPINLKQGGRGFIYRVPIFIQGHYWGLVSTVIDADSLLKVLQPYNLPARSRLSLSAQDSDDPGSFHLFWGQALQPGDISKHMLLNLPNTQWQLTISRQIDALSPWLVRLTGWLCIFSGMSLYLRWQHHQTLRKTAVQTIRAQQEFSSVILDRVMDGILTLDAEGRMVSMNRAAHSLLGLDASASHTAEHLQTLLTPSQSTQPPFTQQEATRKEAAPQAFAEFIASLTGHFPLHCKISNTPAAGRDVEVLATGLLDVPQARWLVLMRDISERLRNERLKNEFVSTVSHELRTPLTSIAGALGLLANGVLGPLSEQAQLMVNVADSNARRLTLLINDLLDMEKLIAGHMRLHMEECDLAQLLEHALSENRGYAEKFDVTLEFINAAAETHSPLMVSVDTSRMMQVMANLLSNAIKYSPPNGVVTTRLAIAGVTASISVIDRGPGIPEEFHAHIFKKFTQADSSDTRGKGGTGLGLAITKELVEHMGGRITFTTGATQGTCFQIEFPVLDRKSG